MKPNRRFKWRGVLCWLVASALASGVACRRKPRTTPVPQPQPGEPPVASTTPVQPAAPGVPASASAPRDPAGDLAAKAAEERMQAESLRFLNLMLREFIAQNNRFPASFKELENAKVDSPRKAPPGQRWELDARTRTVIVVPK